MNGTGATLVMAVMIVSACRPVTVRAQEETKARQMKKRDRRHVAIMSHGTYSSPMSWDRKTIIVTEDGRIVKEEIYSPNGEFYAQTGPASCVTTVFGIERRGSFGRRFERWSMEGCHELLGLSGDGDRLVLGRRMEGRAIRGSDTDEVILTFVERGLGEIARDAHWMEGLDTVAVPGWYKRLNAAGHYVIETADERPIIFDVHTGERVDVRLDGTGDSDGWKRYVDIYGWFEFQHPGDCIVHERFDFEGYPCGDLRLARGDAGWAVTTRMERLADYASAERDGSSFVEFAIEQSKVMNSADGPSRSLYADSVLSHTLFENPHGIQVLELLLEMVDVEWTDEEEIVERSERGPIYAVLLDPNPNEPRSVLFLSPAYGADEVVGADDVLRRAVDTIRYPQLLIVID